VNSGVRHVGSTPHHEFHVGVLDDASTWSADLSGVLKPFVVMTAFDATRLDDATLYAFARRLILAGCRYVCTWGPDSERVHDIFDAANIDLDESLKEIFVMSTWHDDESLDEALWYATQCAWVEELQDHSQHVLVLAAPEYADHVTNRLVNLDKLIPTSSPKTTFLSLAPFGRLSVVVRCSRERRRGPKEPLALEHVGDRQLDPAAEHRRDRRTGRRHQHDLDAIDCSALATRSPGSTGAGPVTSQRSSSDSTSRRCTRMPSSDSTTES
jgi:hypothetical protein